MGGRRRDVRLEIRQYKSQEKAAGLKPPRYEGE
jgi:hypothetical protein